MSASRELPISTFSPPSLMLPPEDYIKIVRECDRILAKIKQLQADFTASLNRKSGSDPVSLPEVLSELSARNAP